MEQPSNNNEETDWKPYYETHTMPDESLQQAVHKYLPNGGIALDLGAGNLRDTKFLLEKGFTVTAVDPSPDSYTYAEKLNNEKLTFVQKLAGYFEYPKDHFDLVNVQNLLSLFPKQRFDGILKAIRSTIKPGGILCASFLGPNDDWKRDGQPLTFLTKEDIALLFPDFEILDEIETEEDSVPAQKQIAGLDEPKHWHLINIIARKKTT